MTHQFLTLIRMPGSMFSMKNIKYVGGFGGVNHSMCNYGIDLIPMLTNAMHILAYSCIFTTMNTLKLDHKYWASCLTFPRRFEVHLQELSNSL
jgi:hypothetical protein